MQTIVIDSMIVIIGVATNARRPKPTEGQGFFVILSAAFWEKRGKSKIINRPIITVDIILIILKKRPAPVGIPQILLGAGRKPSAGVFRVTSPPTFAAGSIDASLSLQ